LSARGLLEPQPRERFLTVPPPGAATPTALTAAACGECRDIRNNAGLCGPVVPLSSGRTYSTSDTALGLSCLTGSPITSAPTTVTPTIVGQTWTPTTSPTTVPPTGVNTLENDSDYQACIASPSTCTQLYVPPSSVAVPSRTRVARMQLSSHEVAVTPRRG
jgi:hypothetical protein